MPGAILAVISAVLFGISLAMQKYAVGAMKKFSIGAMAKNKTWLIALLVGVAGILVYLVALNMADLSAVQPLTSLSVVIPILIGVALFKEKMEVKKWLFALILLAGIVIASVF